MRLAVPVPRTMDAARLSASPRLGIRSATALLFLLDLAVNYQTLTPRFFQINPDDEAIYANNGRLLAEGTLPQLAWNPLGAMFYAALYFPLQHQTSWMVLANWAARCLLFGAIWLTSYLIARQLRAVVQPMVYLTLLVLTPIVPTLLDNTSDALFSVMSGLAFWQVLAFSSNRRFRHVWIASGFVALAELTRNDGVVLLALLIVTTLIVLWSRPPDSAPPALLRSIGTAVMACVLPFGLIVGGYILLHGLTSGSYATGVKARSYDAFEQGQDVVYSLAAGRNSEAFVEESMIQARQVYGTADQNRSSVWRAIRHNPRAFVQRLLVNVLSGFQTVVVFYGGLGFLVLLPLAIIGVRYLMRNHQSLIATSGLLWASHILVYLAFFFRGGYVLLPYFVPLLFAAVGWSAVGPRLVARGRPWHVPAGLAGLVLLVFFQHNVLLTPMTLALVATVAAGWLVLYPNGDRRVLALAVGLCALLLAGIYQPERHSLAVGATGEERAARYMAEHLPPGTVVGAWHPAVIWMARMTYQDMSVDNFAGVRSEEDLSAWISATDARAILVDPWLRQLAPTAYALILQDVGTRFDIAFSFDDNDAERAPSLLYPLSVQRPERFMVLTVRADR